MAIVQSDGALEGSNSFALPRSASLAGGVPWYSGAVADYAAIYRYQPNVRMVCDFYARNIAQIELKPYLRTSATDRESLGDTDLGRLLRYPNEATKKTRYKFFLELISDLCIFDNVFILKVRNPETGKLRLFRLPPQLMQPATDEWYYASAWKFLGHREQPIFSSDDMIHIHGYNPDDSRMGLSPIETLRQILAEGEAAATYREQYWRNGARISGVIERPTANQGTPRWSNEAKARFMAEWQAAYSGAGVGAGGTPLLEDGMVFKQVAFSAKDSEYITARKLAREEVASQYHLSPVFVGILDNANFSNVKEFHRHLYQDGLGPPMKMVAEELKIQLLPEFPELDFESVYLEFDLAEKLKGSFEERAALLQTATGGPWMTRNEARAEENYPRIDGADELIIPLNVIEGGQASPTDSAPPAELTQGSASRTTMKAIAPAKKSAEDLPDSIKEWFDQHVEILVSTFDRQKRAVEAAIGAGRLPGDEVWKRWDRELKADFLRVALEMKLDIGERTAEELGGTFDEETGGEYLEENSRIAAENVNFATREEIEKEDIEGDRLDHVRNVFATAAESRAAQIAISRTNSTAQFARHEAATQTAAVTGAGMKKVWRVRSSNSRHPRMNGQRVDIGEKFSNGARWPGDPSLSVDERAECTCELDIERES